MKDAIISRVKIMSKLDIGESALPQDGRIMLKMASTAARAARFPRQHAAHAVGRKDRTATPR